MKTKAIIGVLLFFGAACLWFGPGAVITLKPMVCMLMCVLSGAMLTMAILD